MEFEVQNIVTLGDDSKYMIMSQASFEGANYMFLMNTEDEKDYKFCNVMEGKLYEIKDDELIVKVAPILYKSLVEEIGKI